MSKYAPARSELQFRLWVSVAGLCFLLGAILFRGLPKGPAMFEIVVIAGGFFGGTLIWTLRKLKHSPHEDGN
jgi:hypothetical protein